MEESSKHDDGRAAAGLANTGVTIAPTPGTASGTSEVSGAATDPSAPEGRAVTTRSRRRRGKSPSASSNVSQSKVSVSHHSLNMEQPNVPVSAEGSKSSAASSVPPQLTSSSASVTQTPSRSGRPRREHSLNRADCKDRHGMASYVEGPQTQASTRQGRASPDARPGEADAECSAAKSNQPEVNFGSKPGSPKVPGESEPRGTVWAMPASMAQQRHSTTSQGSNTTSGGGVIQRPDAADPGITTDPGKSRLNLTTAKRKLKAPGPSGVGGGTAEQNRDIRGLLEMKDLASEKQQPPVQSLYAIVVEEAHQHRRVFAFVAFQCAAAVILLVCLFIVPMLGSPSTVSVCGNSDCVDHVAALSLTHDNYIASPCENFGEFVCSGVQKRHSLADDVIVQMVFRYRSESIRRYFNDSLFGRPFQLIRRCLDVSSRDEDSMRALADFLKGKSFAWPTPNDTGSFPDPDGGNYSRPLQILLDLAVNWAIPLWFRCALLRVPRGDRAVRISPSGTGSAGKKFHELVVSSSMYASYAEFVASTIFSLRKPSPAFESFVRRSEKIQMDVFSGLAAVETYSLFEAKRVPLGQTPSLVPRLSVDDWTGALRAVYNVRPPIHRDDVLFVTNHRLLVVANALLESYSPQDIAFHTVWWFAQYILFLTSSSVYNAVNHNRMGEQLSSVYCTVLSRTLYAVFWAAASKAATSVEDQVKITRFLETVKITAVDKVVHMTGIGNASKHALKTMLERTETVVWPSGTFATPEGLKHLYGPAHNGSDGVFAELTATARFLQRSIGRYEGTLAARIFVPAGIRQTFYDPAQSAIYVAPELIGPPLYYLSGTSAMVYGGLGFVYAIELMTALYGLHAIMHDRDVVNVAFQSRNEASLWDNASCKNSHLVYPALAALGVAHDAYLRFRDAYPDRPLKGLRYSAEQIFFISLCHSTCSFYPNGTSFSPRCNEMVKNFAPFAEAFSCTPGSPMNPAEKCQSL